VRRVRARDERTDRDGVESEKKIRIRIDRPNDAWMADPTGELEKKRNNLNILFTNIPQPNLYHQVI